MRLVLEASREHCDLVTQHNEAARQVSAGIACAAADGWILAVDEQNVHFDKRIASRNGFTDKNGCEAISRMDLYSQRCCRAE